MTRHDSGRTYRALAFALAIYLLGCFAGDEPVDSDPDRELDDLEAEQFGCPGAYVYDWQRNCRYPSQRLCDLEHVACQDTEIRNAYDVDGTCWRFNTCIPDANYWPADDFDVCHHSRAAVTFCDDAEVDCAQVETREQCELAPQCQPALGFEWDPENLCAMEGFEPRYLGCVEQSEACSELDLFKLGDGCILTSACATPDCPGGDCGGCTRPETLQGCGEWRSELRLVRFDPDGTALPQPIELSASPPSRPDECIAASLGEAKFRSGTSFYDQPAADSSRWELLVPVRNDALHETCGFEGAAIELVVGTASGASETTVAYWPQDVPCDGDVWIQVVIYPAKTAPSYDIRLSAVDSCRSGGGTITRHVDVQ